MNPRLLKIEQLFSTKIPELAGALNKGATPAALDKLGEELGRELPADLREILAWHDGQRMGSGFSFFANELNWTLMSVEQVAEAYRFLTTEPDVRRYDASWIPWMDNGAGDYLVIRTGRSNAGQVWSYYHDDPPKKQYSSVADLLDQVIEILEGYQDTRLGVPAVDQLRWTKVADGKALELEKIKAVYLRQSSSFQPHLNHRMFVRIADDEWAEDCTSVSKQALFEGGRVFPDQVCSTSMVRIRLEHFHPGNKESLPEHEIGIFVGE